MVLTLLNPRISAMLLHNALTLYDPKFFTEHANFTLLPAATVTFSIWSVNSGSSPFGAETKEKNPLTSQ